eukprot:m.214202 g.214202  ORF g.214202 m.214202 type:complete len:260 (+) comp17188_c0_seq1:246-1025(+)
MSLDSDRRKLRHTRSTDAITGHYRSVHVEGRRSNDQTAQNHAPYLNRIKQETAYYSPDASAVLGSSHMSTQSLYSGSTGVTAHVSVNEAFDDGEVQHVQDELAILNEEVAAGNMRAFGKDTEAVFKKLDRIRTEQFQLVNQFLQLDLRIAEQRQSGSDIDGVQADFQLFSSEIEHEEQALMARMEKVTSLVQSFASAPTALDSDLTTQPTHAHAQPSETVVDMSQAPRASSAPQQVAAEVPVEASTDIITDYAAVELDT